MKEIKIILLFLVSSLLLGCLADKRIKNNGLSASQILGNPKYKAIAYGGYRTATRELQPTIKDIKEDLLLLEAMGIKVLRTYNVHLPMASNVLKAIRELKAETPSFEMYVMLGAWIDCKDAWTSNPNHEEGSDRNKEEIKNAVHLANEYPEIVKILAVGNEAMVKWATSYYVQPKVILQWVSYLQELKSREKLPSDLWITSSDNFASWGGGDAIYHNQDLIRLYKAVDYVSMHTYPMHDTHYNPIFWKVEETHDKFSKKEKIQLLMQQSQNYAKSQYEGVKNYMKSIGVEKEIHIGETGWATNSKGLYGADGSRATDEYKQALYYQLMNNWTSKEGITCFFFEAFDEHWKDSEGIIGSENNFGLFTLNGKAKYALWSLVENDAFEGLTRNGNRIIKTFNGKEEQLMEKVFVP